MNATVPKINITRVFIGGAVAGLVIFAINGVVNGAILRAQFQAWAIGMGEHLHPPTFPVALGLWLVLSWLLGTAGVWIAAGIVARGHTRMPAALRAGVMIWIIGKAAVALDFVAIGLLPSSLVTGQLICGLVAILVGVCGGAVFYRE
jgi:hypothetical protein